MNAQQILEKLTEAYAQRDLLAIEETEQIKKIMPVEVTLAIADMAAEYTPRREAIGAKIAELEAQAKEAVIAEGASVKGGALQAVFMKGRVSWDSKMLDGLTIVIPELNQARKVGEPSVSIRKIG